MKQTMISIKDLGKFTMLPILLASLCCLVPVILVLVGISTVSFAASLTNVLDGRFKWVFNLVGVIALGASITVYFRRRGICTLDQATRHRDEVVNKILLFVITGVIMYYIFFYVLLNSIGKVLHIWQ